MDFSLGVRLCRSAHDDRVSLMLAGMVKKPQGKPVIECKDMQAAWQGRSRLGVRARSVEAIVPTRGEGKA